MRFRSKPCEIDALKITEENADKIMEFVGADRERVSLVKSAHRLFALGVWTQHGQVLAGVGDWLIRGTRGEYYPCKNEVFIEKYEPIPRK